MVKTYAQCMDEISAERLYEGLLGYGLFSEKLPPIFTSEDFYLYCSSKKYNFQNKEHDYITFEAMRNINTTRAIGIPNPMAYERLCSYLKLIWPCLQQHFYEQTSDDSHKVSRIHIRRLFDKKNLFEMNYENWRIDGSPEVDLRNGCRYRVKADISTCFPSLYTHAIPWVLVGKEFAKAHREGDWYNELDERCRNIKNGETLGVLIGPHAFNLISEIILTAVDKELAGLGWKFTRHIDDYTCYVSSFSDAQRFLQMLSKHLRNYGFLLNSKKTLIEEFPLCLEEHWVNLINSINLKSSYGITTYKEVCRYFDTAIELYQDNKNGAIFYYAFKALSNNEMSKNAQKYCVKTAFHLALNITYLVPVLQKNILEKFLVEKDDIKNFSDELFKKYIDLRYFEPICYSIYFSLKYNFYLEAFDVDRINETAIFKHIMESDDCIVKLFLFLYCKKYWKHSAINKIFVDHALALQENDMDKNWLFVYEVLSEGQLKGDWISLKKQRVSFLATEFRYR